MKTLVAVILALGVGFATAYVVVTKQKNAQLEKLKAQPAVVAEAAPAPEPVEKVVMVAAPAAPAEESAEDILNDLLNVKLGVGGTRNTGLRIVIYKLESLSQRGKTGGASHPRIHRAQCGFGLQPAGYFQYFQQQHQPGRCEWRQQPGQQPGRIRGRRRIRRRIWRTGRGPSGS